VKKEEGKGFFFARSERMQKKEFAREAAPLPEKAGRVSKITEKKKKPRPLS